MKFGFVGLGNMAYAIIRGMHKSGVFASDIITGINRSSQKTDILKTECAIIPAESIASLVRDSDIIILCVKPQVLPTIIDDVAKNINGKPVVTIAAGKTLSWYSERLPATTPVIRVMPNINAKVGASMTAVCKNQYVSDDALEIARKIFTSVGNVYEIGEELFPAFSAVCGASGAFIMLYLDALSEAAVRSGFSRKLAEEFAVGTVLGSAKLKAESSEHPIALMDTICSPGGTTIEGVIKLKELGFENSVIQGINAIIEKDRKL